MHRQTMPATAINDRYVLGDLLGRGGMSEVFLAYDQVLGRQVAIKTVMADTDPEGVRRVHLEGRAIAALQHSGIVGLYDLFSAHGRWYLVLEFVPGRSVAARLAEGLLSVREVYAVGAAVADALSEAHRHGIVHRDVKPANVLIRSDGVVKLADFGVARLSHMPQFTQPGLAIGTLRYMPPEQARGEPVGPAADMYALGATLYELLTGAPPFDYDSPAALVQAHQFEAPVPPRRLRPDVPPDLETLILDLLAKKPEQRPDSARAAHRLRAGQIAAPVRRAPSVRALLIGGLVALCVVAALLLARPSERHSAHVIAAAEATATPATTEATTAPLNEAPVATPEPDVTPLTVPDVRGIGVAQAEVALQAYGLVAEHRQVASLEPAGVVIEQRPAPGEHAIPAMAVILDLSSGPSVMPDVHGLSQDEALAQLQAAGLGATVELTPDRDHPAGLVIRQATAPGDNVLPGSLIVLTISQGDVVAMPVLEGMMAEEACRQLASLDLFCSYIDAQDASKLGERYDEGAPGTVVSSEPAAGTWLPRGSGVTLGVRAPTS